MRQFAISVFAVLALLPTACQAQLFPRLFGGKQTSQVGSACPGGVCPTAAPASNYRSVGVNLTRSGTSWVNRDGLSPRQHIEQRHGTETSGMSEAEVLAARDDYHNTYGEGHPVNESRSRSIGLTLTRANTQQVNYPAVSSASGYGSSGVSVSGYGSIGSFGVGTVLPDGGVVTSVGVTVAAKTGCGCGCPNCTCGGEQSASEPQSMQGIGDLFDRRSDKVAFRKSLFEAIKRARAEGKIDEFQAFAIRGLSWMPGNLEIMQATLHEAAIEDGVASAQASNWEKLIELIIKYLPYILDLFKK